MVLWMKSSRTIPAVSVEQNLLFTITLSDTIESESKCRYIPLPNVSLMKLLCIPALAVEDFDIATRMNDYATLHVRIGRTRVKGCACNVGIRRSITIQLDPFYRS